MKWVKLTTAVIALSVAAGSVSLAGQKPAAVPAAHKDGGAGQQLDPSKVVGKVGTHSIRLIDVMERIRRLPPQLQQVPIEQLYPNILQQMAAQHAVVKKAREKGLDKSVDFKKAKQEVELNLLQEMYLFGGLKESFSDAELKAEYDAYIKSFVVEDQVKARHILVKEEKEAEDIIAKIKAGEDFSKLAETKSIDHLSAKRGGDLDFFGRKDLIPEFTKTAFDDLKDGQMTEKPVKTSFGYHIIKREESRKKAPAAFEKAKADLLPNRLRQKEIQSRLKSATDSTKIELFNLDGSSLKMEDMSKSPQSQEAAQSDPVPSSAAAPAEQAGPKESAGAPVSPEAHGDRLGDEAGKVIQGS